MPEAGAEDFLISGCETAADAGTSQLGILCELSFAEGWLSRFRAISFESMKWFSGLSSSKNCL